MVEHQPVLLQEVIAGLAPRPGETVLDATVNRGGHAREICRMLAAHGRLIGLDADRAALAEARENMKLCPCPVTLVEGNFRSAALLLEQAGLEQIDAALFDLGFSSQQLEKSGRGFSFGRDEPLVMTFQAGPAPGTLTADQIINGWSEIHLADIIYGFGGEKFARRIAAAIVARRQTSPIAGTADLVAVIGAAVPRWYRIRRRHFATKTFQALRLAVNDELGALKSGLEGVWPRLRRGGRLGVITFHSLEAKIVKGFYRQRVEAGDGELLNRHAIRSSRAELIANPHSRSAQLRLIKKIHDRS